MTYTRIIRETVDPNVTSRDAPTLVNPDIKAVHEAHVANGNILSLDRDHDPDPAHPNANIKTVVYKDKAAYREVRAAYDALPGRMEAPGVTFEFLSEAGQ